ncbi:armadillo-type protein [Mycena crocata]|nr:armadillo-type protein [Mycena crocata]
MIGHMDPDVRKSALRTLVILAHNENVRAAILIPETVQRIASMIGDAVPDIALQALVELAHDNNVRAVFLMPQTVQTLTAMLADTIWDVQKSALDAMVHLAQHNDIRAAILPAEAIENIIAMLENNHPDLRKSALQTLVVLLQRSRPSFLPSRLWRAKNHSRMLRSSILALKTTQKITRLLGDAVSDVRKLANDTIVSLACDYDDVRIAMTDPETVKQILFMVGYNNADMRTGAIQCVVALLRHAFKAFKSSISTPTSLVKILQTLTGGAGDPEILELMREIIKSYDGISLDGIALIHAILERITVGGLAARESHMEVIKMLPLLRIVFPPGHADKLIPLLEVPELPILDFVSGLVVCFSVNAQFRQQILKPEFWRSTLTLLQTPSTASKILKILTVFAQYDDALPKIIHSSSGIVHELLQMLNTGAADIGRWRIGVEGLLALRLFKLE